MFTSTKDLHECQQISINSYGEMAELISELPYEYALLVARLSRAVMS